MSENLITIPARYSQVVDEFAVKKDRRKAYQIFALSGVTAIAASVLLYLLTVNLLQ